MMLDPAQESLRSNEFALRTELEAAGVVFRGKACRCPFHDDKTPSAGIYCDDGVWRFKCQGCQAGGDIFDVRALLHRRPVGEELAAARSPVPKPLPPTKVYPTIESLKSVFPNVEAVYKYTDPDTFTIDMIVIRYRDGDKKRFAQASPTPGGYKFGAPAGSRPVYNRGRLRTTDTVIVVEGEKCVHALHDIGIVATTSPQGALNGNLANWQPLAGKTVFLWPDYDAPTDEFPEGKGVEHMRQVQKILQTLSPPCTVFWIDPKKLELPEKGDAADFVERYKGWKPEDVRGIIEAEIMAEAEPVGISGDYAKYMEDGIAGKRRTLPFPWLILTKASRALVAGTAMCICGDPGSGKSFSVMQAMIHWTAMGIKACVYQLEDDRNYHLARAHAQMAKNAQLTESEWLENNPVLARELRVKYQNEIAEIGQRIWESPDEQVSLEMLATWVEERAKAGYEIICIDPVTAAATEAKPWAADCKFIMRVKMIARRYGARIVMVIHPRKGQDGKGSLDDMAGGAAYPRFCHTVFWIMGYDKKEELMVRQQKNYPPESCLPNRIGKIVKCRNGKGRGLKIAMDFDPQSLTFRELGVIESA